MWSVREYAYERAGLSRSFGGERRELGPRGDTEFGEDVAQVRRDGSRRDEQLVGDLLVGQSLGHELDDLALGRSETVPTRRRPLTGTASAQRVVDGLLDRQ